MEFFFLLEFLSWCTDYNGQTKCGEGGGRERSFGEVWIWGSRNTMKLEISKFNSTVGFMRDKLGQLDLCT